MQLTEKLEYRKGALPYCSFVRRSVIGKRSSSVSSTSMVVSWAVTVSLRPRSCLKVWAWGVGRDGRGNRLGVECEGATAALGGRGTLTWQHPALAGHL